MKRKATKEEVTVNVEQGLYVIPEGGGYSCLGFDRVIFLQNGIAEWTRLPELCARPELRGTLAGYAAYLDAMSIASAKNLDTGERCPVELIPQLIGLEGKRVEVVDRWDQTRRFIVGKSMGWMPCHLEISKRTSSGGPAVSGEPFKSVRVLTDKIR